MSATLPVAFWSLKTKLALCSGGLMLVFSLLFGSWALGDFEADVREAVTASQLALARAAAGHIDARIEERGTMLRRVATIAAHDRAAPGWRPGTLLAAFPFVAELFDTVALVEADGRVVFDSSPAAAAGGSVSPAERALIGKALAGAPISISSPIATAAPGSAAIVFAAPWRSPDGRIDAVLLGRLRLDRPDVLGPPGAYRIGRTGFVAVIENNENPVFVVHGRNPARTLQPAASARADPLLAPAFAGQEGSVQRTDSLGVETLSCFVSLRAVPWVLFTVFPTAEAFAQLRERRRAVAGVGAGLCVLAAALAWLLSRWLLRPLSELHAAIDRNDEDPGLAMSPGDAGSSEVAAVVVAYNAQSARRHDIEERLAASERRMAAVTNNIPAFIAHLDPDQRCTFVNAGARAMFSSDGPAAPGQTLRQVLGDDALQAQVESRVATALKGQVAQFETAGVVRGRARHHQWCLVPDIATFGHVRGFYAMAFDITSLDEARARQAKVEQQLRAITDNLPVLISYIDREERFVFMNATHRTWFGIDPALAIGRSMPDHVDPVQRPRVRAKLRRCLRGERVVFELEMETSEGPRTIHTVFVPDLGTDDEVVGLYAVGTDVTALRDAERQLNRLVRCDALTGLANRFEFNEALPRALARCARSGHALALMFLDVDHFKRINDTLGHAGGDAALKEIARRLQGSVRTTDLVARLAGDEFVVILEGLRTEAEPEQIARKVLAAVEQPFDIEGRQIDITVSVGIAYRANADVSAPEILARADSALYAAKDAGRNNYRMAVMA